MIFTSEEWQKLSLSREWCIRLDLRKPPRMLNPGNFTLGGRLLWYINPTKQQNIYVNQHIQPAIRNRLSNGAEWRLLLGVGSINVGCGTRIF